MPGDSLIPDSTDISMLAVTVNARPDNIWPWLVQIGYQRGGLYSYDWLDRLFGSLDRPWGRSGTELIVGLIEPCRADLLRAGHFRAPTYGRRGCRDDGWADLALMCRAMEPRGGGGHAAATGS